MSIETDQAIDSDLPPFAHQRRKKRTDTAGKQWEHQLERWHREYDRALEVHLEKQNAEAKHIEGKLRFVGKGSPDYGGTIYGSARSIWFDAKDTQSNRFSLGQFRDPKRTLHQARSLLAHHRAGAVSFLCVRFHRKGLQVVFPWAVVQVALDSGDRTLGPEQGIPFGPDGWWPVVVTGWKL